MFKKKFIIWSINFCIIILLIPQLVFSQISYRYDEITTVSMEEEKVGGSETKYIFSQGEDSSLKVNEIVFKNIQKPGDGREAYVILKNNWEIIEVDFTTNGDYYTMDNKRFYAPKGSRVLYKKGERIRVFPPENSELKIPGFLDEADDTMIEFNGENLIIREENKFSGKLAFGKDGSMKISAESLGRTFIINGIEFDGLVKEFPNIFNLYFDGEEHEGNYISFNGKTLRVGTKHDQFLIFKFLKDNNLARIDEGDHFSIKLGGGSSANLYKIGGEFKPEVITKGDKVRIEQDGKSITAVGDDIYVRNLRTGHGVVSSSSPIILTMLKKDGTPYLGEFVVQENLASEIAKGALKGYRIVIDNFNRFGLIPEDAIEDKFNYETIDVLFSSKIRHEYPDEETIESSTGIDVEFISDPNSKEKVIPKGQKEAVLGRFLDYWSGLSEDIKKELKKIVFKEVYLSDEELNTAMVYIARSQAGGKGDIEFPMSKFFNIEGILHETAHIHHDALTKEFADEKSWRINTEIRVMGSMIERLKEKDPESPKIQEYEKRISDLRKQFKDLPTIPYNREWVEIDKYYGQKVNPKKYGEGLAIYKPRFGYTRHYGATSLYEDIASFVEKSRDIDFWKPLISEDNQWNHIYRAKLAKLVEWKFISKKQYDKIMEVADK